MNLHLVLTHHWFDEILAGRKLVEYREITPHWRKRIWERRDEITHVTFSRGYTRRMIAMPVERIDVGPCPYDGWDGDYYRIHLDLAGLS